MTVPLPELVDDVIKLDNLKTVGKLFADAGAYDNNEIFRFLT